jgi:hypothetical protein
VGCSLSLGGEYYRLDSDTEADADHEIDEILEAVDAVEDDYLDETDAAEDPAEDDPPEEDVREDDPAEDDPPVDAEAEDAMEEDIVDVVADDPGVDDVAPTTGEIVVMTTPAGAQVFMDTFSMGAAPLTIHSVTPGTHTIELKLTGYYLVELDVDVTAGATTYVNETMEATIPIPCTSFRLTDWIWKESGTSNCFPITMEYGVVDGLPEGPHYVRGYDIRTFYDRDPYTEGNLDWTCSNMHLDQYRGGILERTWHLIPVSTCP